MLERQMMTTPGLDPMLPRPYRVLRLWDETADTFSLELEPNGPQDGFAFAPGQFNMLYLFGVGEVPISISCDPAKPMPLVHTVRAVGPVTQGLKLVEQHQVVGMRGPFGSHWPVEQAEGNDVVLVAGGIGLAPLRPAIYQILAKRERFGNVVLLYGARTPQDMLYSRELQEWRGRFDIQVEITVDSAAAGWRDRVGVVTTLIECARCERASAVAMICGPEIMMRFTIMELQNSGVAPEHTYVSMERNMKCAVGFCGHCQFGPTFICKDGPIFRYDRIRSFFEKREI
jgi:NAD(P)H-flavin reductase